MPSLIRQIAAAGSDPAICRSLLARLADTLAGRKLRFMEVCGTHTVSIFQSGLRSLLPENITHLSGPGCPVCVTHESEIALLLEIAARPDTIIATFGDLLRVPGPGGRSLRHAMASGAHVEIVYSPLASLELAKAYPQKSVIFIGIGFETTAPAVAASIITARAQGLRNFTVLCLHKLVSPALALLLSENDAGIDAFLLPGHVATVTGPAPFQYIATEFRKPCAIAGFEPADILLGLLSLAQQLRSGQPEIANTYPRAVAPCGNPRARELMETVFEPANAHWRGLGMLAKSGLAIRSEFAEFDARPGLSLQPATGSSGCLCGNILRGRAQPPDCPLFGKKCTPASPVGPCMVSTEGSCAAWFKYGNA